MSISKYISKFFLKNKNLYYRGKNAPMYTYIIEFLYFRGKYRSNLFFASIFRDCFQLVKIVLEPEEWPAFVNYLDDVKTLKESFSRSEIIYVPKTQNSMADRLARSVRKQPSFVVHRDANHPVWFTESVWICKVDDKKKLEIKIAYFYICSYKLRNFIINVYNEAF